MSLTLPERVLIAPDEILEGERASLIASMAVARAWRDPDYRLRLVTRPREVLTGEGLDIPAGMEFRVFEDTPDVRHVANTSLTSEPGESEPGELVPLSRELMLLPDGSQVRLIQNTEQAFCLVMPLAPPEPEPLTDADKLRQVAPRASVYVTPRASAFTVTDSEGTFDPQEDFAGSIEPSDTKPLIFPKGDGTLSDPVQPPALSASSAATSSAAAVASGVAVTATNLVTAAEGVAETVEAALTSTTVVTSAEGIGSIF
jgi:hypothetical protein